MTEPKIVMQPRCIYCLREQYVLAVLAVSRGEAGCTWCGQVPPVFHVTKDYYAVLEARRAEPD